MEAGAHILVRGMVQGVGFRFFVHGRAIRLGLTGSVCNLPGGDVRIDVEGERSLIEEFIREVRIGPRAAHVADLLVQWKDPSSTFRGFEIL